MKYKTIRKTFFVASACAFLLADNAESAQSRYDTGANDKEIVIGNIIQYSGPLSAYGTVGKSISAYVDKVNQEGGINGRKVRFISVDDAYVPAKTVEQARKLVEQDEVLAIFMPLGTGNNLAIQKYMNARKVPQLFVGTGATRFGEIKANPWTIGWQPTYHTEAAVFAKHIIETKPNAKIAVLMQNDEFGKDFYRGFMEGIGNRKSMILSTQSYETSDPTIDSQLTSLKATGADTLMLMVTPKFGAMAVKKAAEIGWKPTVYLPNVANSVAAVLKPAGVDAAKGVISATYLRDPSDASTQSTKEYSEYATFMKKYYPSGDPQDMLNVLGYSSAQTLVQTLKQCGDDLTRANLMKQALSLNINLPMLAPGVNVKTGPADGYPIERLQMIRFNGSRYEPLGSVLGR
jgi:branched-chain amino acid transport system substrate-binding protein